MFCTVTLQRRSSGPHLWLSGPRWDVKIKSGGIPHFQTETLLISASSGFCIDSNTCYLLQPELNDNMFNIWIDEKHSKWSQSQFSVVLIVPWTLSVSDASGINQYCQSHKMCFEFSSMIETLETFTSSFTHTFELNTAPYWAKGSSWTSVTKEPRKFSKKWHARVMSLCSVKVLQRPHNTKAGCIFVVLKLSPWQPNTKLYRLLGKLQVGIGQHVHLKRSRGVI